MDADLERTLRHIAGLSYRERDILMRLHCPQPDSVGVLAARFGVAPERIQAIHDQAIKVLEHHVGSGLPASGLLSTTWVTVAALDDDALFAELSAYMLAQGLVESADGSDPTGMDAWKRVTAKGRSVWVLLETARLVEEGKA